MAHLSISVDSQDSDSVRKLDNLMDVDQLKGDFNKASEDLYDSECHNKYVDSLKTEVNKDFIISESPVKDCIDEVKETYVNAGIDNLVEPSAMCLNKTQADEDIISQFSADLNLSLDENSSLQERSKETDTNDVKDICIDEGLPIKEKIYLVEDEEFGYKNANLETECRIPVSLKSSTDLERGKDFNSSESIVPVKPHESTNETKKLVLRDFLKEKVVETLSTRDTAADDSQLKSSAWNRCINEQDMPQKNTSTETEVGTCKSRSPTSEETTNASKMEHAQEEINKSSHLPSINNKDEKIGFSTDLLKLPDTAQMPRRIDPFLKASAPLQRDHFESSFASVGHYSGSITYSGPIAHSGSLSHRSDASTASTRSFAFPVLKNEWNFSPVRMQKADRRQRRMRRWMNGFFCCKF